MRTDLAKEDFVGEGAVYVGGVEQGDPAAESVRDDGDAGLVVQRGVVRARQSHTPEPQLGHLHNQSAESIQSKHRASGQRESGAAAAATR